MLLAWVLCAAVARAEGLPGAGLSFLHVEDGRFVNESGERVVLKGCNLGNWLLVEPWMLGQWDRATGDQHDLEALLETRFGTEERDQPARTNTVLVDLERPGRHTFRLKYYENSGEAVVRPVWDCDFAGSRR